jgi:hypothetical protein
LPGDPLPDEQVILPEPEELHGCAVAETPSPCAGADGPPVVTRRPTTEFKERLERLKTADKMRQMGLEPTEDES